MTSSDTPKETKFPVVFILLLALVAALGGGLAYWAVSDTTPAWVSFLLPSSPYDTGARATAEPEQEATQDQTAEPAQSPEPGGASLPENDALSVATPAGPESPPEPAPSAPDESAAEQAAASRPGDSPMGDALPEEPSPVTGDAGALSDAPSASPSSTGEEAQREGAASGAAQSGETTNGDPLPLIMYGKGKAVTEGATIVQGDIPKEQQPPDTTVLYGTGDAPESQSRASGEDSIVSFAFIDDLASFLVENYWPEGTHPMARGHGITTAGIKWANMRYGTLLRGFVVNSDNGPQERERVLRYAFMPSMIQGLHRLYGKRFIDAVDQKARAQVREDGKTPLTTVQLAEMFDIYSGMARGLAGTVRSYRNTASMRTLVNAYTDAAAKAATAYQHFVESMHANAVDKAARAQAYQQAVMLREQQKEHLAAALRRGGPTRGLDADSVVHTALWLARRGEAAATTDALASVCDDIADRLAAKAKFYGSSAAAR